MKKKQECGGSVEILRKTMRIMRLSLILIIFSTTLAFSATSYSQSTRLSLKLKEATVEKVFQSIEKKSEFLFFYQEKHVDLNRRVTLHFSDKDIRTILDRVFKGTDNIYVINDRQIVIGKAPRTELEKQIPYLKGGVFEKLDQPQEKTISGKVTDMEGLPLPGVSVIVKGTTIGTVTDANGAFSLSVPANAETLQFSFVGMVTQVVALAGKNRFQIVMEEDYVGIDEVVAVGYGIQKKSSLTSAISTLEGDNIKTTASANISNMLGGKMAGVIASQGSGEPGHDESSLFIRGVGTISGENQPLIVINGVISSMDMLNSLDQNAIKSVTVLKDAAAVAPYGMAGANGVILITLKSGEVSKPKLSYDMYYGFQNPTRVIDRLNSYQFAKAYNIANANMGVSPMFTPEEVEGFKKTTEGAPDANPDAYPNTNAFEQYRNKNTPMTSHSLSLTGGSEIVKYYLNFSYLNQQGMWETANRNRYSLVSNIGIQATKTTELKLNINGSRDITREPGIGGENIMNITQLYLPIDPTIFSNGLLGAAVPLPGRNGGLVLDHIINSGYLDISSTIVQSQLAVVQQIPFVKGLSVSGFLTYTPNFWAAKQWQVGVPPYYRYNRETGEFDEIDRSLDDPARLYQRKMEGENLNYIAKINYQNTFGKHALAFDGIVDITDGDTNDFEGAKKNYVLNIDELDQGSPNKDDWTTLSGSSDYFRWIGYIGRLEYNYNSKYFLEATARYDGHYFFAPGHKFGLFPAVSMSWRLSEEEFVKNNFPFVDNFKFRTSYGVSGNLASGPFQYLSAYDFQEIGAVLEGDSYSALKESSEPNPLITWEQANKFNVGMDINLWKGKLNLTTDYFFEKRSNMLVSPLASVSSEYGIGLTQVNDGIMENQGIEFTLSSMHQFGRDFNAGIKADFSFARNKLLEIYESPATRNDPERSRTGRPLNTLFGLEADRLFQERDFDATGELILDTDNDGIQDIADPGLEVHPGDIKYVDINGDGEINGEDETVIGKAPLPEIMYGINPYVQYKGFDLNVFLQGAGNNSILMYEQITQPFFTAEINPVAEVVTDAWAPDNKDARYPRLLSGQRTNNATVSSWWVWDASYLRIKNVELGYNLPQHLLDKFGFETCRLYVSGNNLHVFTRVPFIDPEVSADGLARNDQGYGSGASYPQQRTFQFGLNLTFK